MNLRKLFRNPEAKRTTIKFLIILILGIISIFGVANVIADKMNKIMVRQNTSLYAEILSDKSNVEIIKNFYSIKSDEEIKSAKKILKEYGYDEDISLSSNEISSKLYKETLVLFLPVYIVFIIILYILFIRELRGIYKEVDRLIIESSNIGDGKYKKIKGTYKEGDLAILVSSLNYMGDRVNNSIELLKSEKEYLKDFLSDISHQLKTPLASLVMFNDLLRENENMPYEDRRNFLDKSEEQLGRMEWLIMNLLKVGRLEAGVVKFKYEKKSLRDTIELAVSSLRGEANKKNQELIISGELDSEIKHDRGWLAEAISNITKNAIEHTQNGGKILIKVEKGPIITKIFIMDNGPGISEEIQKKVFKRFYKGEVSLNPKSIGIGLSLSKSIIEEQGGEIKLLSEIGKGTTFIISFMDSLR